MLTVCLVVAVVELLLDTFAQRVSLAVGQLALRGSPVVGALVLPV